MASDEDLMSFSEAIAHIMRVTGKNRRQATAALMEKLRSGKIKAWGRPITKAEYEARRKEG